MALDFEDIRPWRVPFYLAPDGTFDVGYPGWEHHEMDDERRWYKRQYPNVPETSMQGFVSFHPEFNKTGWPLDRQTLQELVPDEETQQKVQNAAAEMWKHYGQGTEHWGSFRLGKTVEELATAALDELLGSDSKRGHSAMRPDIQKMKDVYDRWKAAYPNWTQLKMDNEGKSQAEKQAVLEEAEEANEAWNQEMTLDAYEKYLLNNYRDSYQIWEQHPERDQVAFEKTVEKAVADAHYQEGSPSDPAEIKKLLGGALKKYEQQNVPILYSTLKAKMEDMYRTKPQEAYKFYPLAVKWMKDEYKEWLYTTYNSYNRFENPSRMAPWETSLPGMFQHVIDIAGEGGQLLDQLRRENKLPQNFDANKLDFSEFSRWLTEWKQEHREQEAQGDVVYQYHDGWTMQKLTTPEQLEYEGDTMGHCVGGYSYSVDQGEDIIYSLRDPKGHPHVTMEVRGIDGYHKMFDKPANQLTADEGSQLGARMNEAGAFPVYEAPVSRENPTPQLLSGGDPYIFTNSYIHPEHDPSEDYYNRSHANYMVPGDKTFEVVQIMGKGNNTPKPEYQHKIKEFLDSLREKGWNFRRSDDWFAPFDDREEEGHGEWDNNNYMYGNENARHLHEAYENYKRNPEHFQIGYQDAYGMQANRKSAEFNWEKTLEECCASLIDDYDRDRWKTHDWEGLAHAAYHMFLQDMNETRLAQGALDNVKNNAQRLIQDAEQKVMEWCDQNSVYMHETNEFADAVEKKYEELGGKFKDEAYDHTNENNYRDPYGNPYREPEDQDLMDEARSDVENEHNNEYAGNAFKFLDYLYNLFEHEGAVNPEDLPNPNDRDHLPTYDQLRKKNEMIWNQQRMEQLEDVADGLPGALSSTWTNFSPAAHV